LNIKIVILELEHHADNLLGLLDAFSLVENYILEITVITQKWIHKLIATELYQYKNVEFLINNKHYSHKDFILKNVDKINSSDLLFINTISLNFDIYDPIKEKVKIFVRVHNANILFNPHHSFYRKYVFINPLSAILFFIKHKSLKRYISKFQAFKSKVNCFVFPEIEMWNYALENFQDISCDNSCLLPLKLYKEKKGIHSSSDEFKIGIIGALHKSTRDIESIIQLLHHLHKTKFEQTICFSFLGNIQTKAGKKIQNILEKTSSSIKIEYFDEDISQTSFALALHALNCIIIPLNLNTNTSLFTEIYGKTKISGNISDIAISPKPILIPEGYFAANMDGTGVIIYKGVMDLKTKLTTLNNDKNYYKQELSNIQKLAEKRYGKIEVKKCADAIISKI